MISYDYSHYALECQAILRHISERAMRREYMSAAFQALKLARTAIKLCRALREHTL